MTTEMTVRSGGGVMTESGVAREAQEVQAMMIVAKRFPRDEKASIDRIMNACSRPSLAQTAVYQYARRY
jgi:hypothetical protein